jgi:hypothetical protein
MGVSTALRLLRRTPARYLYNRFKMLRRRGGQSDEAAVLKRLAVSCPRTFTEFGFHPTEFNCIGLDDWAGLLVDGDFGTVKLARSLLPERIQIEHRFLTLENLDFVQTYHAELGVLSVDVDGNDYWFLEALLPRRPHIVCVEYNASLGGEAITVPYDASFDRHAKEPSGWYHGASLLALTRLCARHGFKLVAVSQAGGNAFFVREDRELPALSSTSAYRENALRNRWSSTTAAEQWARIKHLPYVAV